MALRNVPVTIILALAVLAMPAFASEAGSPVSDRLSRQAAQYQADIPKTVIELQPFRDTESAVVEAPGGRRGNATLVNLNPRVNSWFVLTLDWGDHGGRTSYHIENPKPAEQSIHL